MRTYKIVFVDLISEIGWTCFKRCCYMLVDFNQQKPNQGDFGIYLLRVLRKITGKSNSGADGSAFLPARNDFIF
jgi:hypothetical protein